MCTDCVAKICDKTWEFVKYSTFSTKLKKSTITSVSMIGLTAYFPNFELCIISEHLCSPTVFSFHFVQLQVF